VAENKTPPTGTAVPRPLPTLATVQAATEAALREMRGARLDIDTLKTEIKAVRSKLYETEEQILRISRLPSTPPISVLPSVPSAPPSKPTPRPSMAAVAAKRGLDLGKYTAIVIGVLSVAGQVAAVFQPKYVGPITAILKWFGVEQ
jgi:hypothetical protein